MASKRITSKQYFRTAKVIHLALVSGVVIFASVASFLMSGEELKFGYSTDTNIFYILVGVLGLWALFGGEAIFRNQIKKAKIQPALEQKMMQYQSANIVKYAWVEGVALFSIVAAMLTLSIWFLVITGFLVLVLASYHPSVDKAVKELDLNVDEQKRVRTQEAYISESMDDSDL